MTQQSLIFDTYQVGSKVFTRDELPKQLEPDPKTMARASDPATSKQAALTVSERSPSQQILLLKTFGSGLELTDEEAGDLSGLSKKPKCCYWKRLSELRQGGYIEDTFHTKASSVGEQQRICRITAKGRDFLAQWDAAKA